MNSAVREFISVNIIPNQPPVKASVFNWFFPCGFKAKVFYHVILAEVYIGCGPPTSLFQEIAEFAIQPGRALSILKSYPVRRVADNEVAGQAPDFLEPLFFQRNAIAERQHPAVGPGGRNGRIRPVAAADKANGRQLYFPIGRCFQTLP